MKSVGIALLFALCSLVGIRLAAKKTAPLKTVRALLFGLQSFADRVASGSTLVAAAEAGNDAFVELLSVYLGALSKDGTQDAAAERAASSIRASASVQSGAELFFSGLSDAPRAELLRRIKAFSDVLERAGSEAETESKQARVLRSAGFLVGTGLAILLM